MGVDYDLRPVMDLITVWWWLIEALFTGLRVMRQF